MSRPLVSFRSCETLRRFKHKMTFSVMGILGTNCRRAHRQARWTTSTSSSSARRCGARAGRRAATRAACPQRFAVACTAASLLQRRACCLRRPLMPSRCSYYCLSLLILLRDISLLILLLSAPAARGTERPAPAARRAHRYAGEARAGDPRPRALASLLGGESALPADANATRDDMAGRDQRHEISPTGARRVAAPPRGHGRREGRGRGEGGAEGGEGTKPSIGWRVSWGFAGLDGGA